MQLLTKPLDINVAGDLVSYIHSAVTIDEVKTLLQNIIKEVNSVTEDVDASQYVLPDAVQNVRDMYSVMVIDRSLKYMAEGGLAFLIRKLNSRHLGMEVNAAFKHIDMIFEHSFVRWLDEKNLLMHVVWVINSHFNDRYKDPDFSHNLLFTSTMFGREVLRHLTNIDIQNFATATIVPNLLVLFLRQ